MAKKKKDVDLFSQFVNLVLRGSWLIVFGILLSLIYLPYSTSINEMFKPAPEPVKGRLASGSGGRSSDENRVVNGIHVATGMIYDNNFTLVKNACTSCHSAKIVTQNRATRDGWKQMIRWMQATQGLPDLGKSEVKILDYLAKNYAPTDVGRRKVLDQKEIEWYTLKLD